MPTYCFRCDPCDRSEEVFASISEAGMVLICPECGGPMRRDFTAEGASSNFHPSRDLYASHLKARSGKRSNNRSRAVEEAAS